MNVVADLTRHNPTAADPTVYEGTKLGVGHTASPPVDQWASQVSSWWTGWWPELHTRVQLSDSRGPAFVFQAKTDLLGSKTLEALAVTDDRGNTIQALQNSNMANTGAQLIIDNLVVLLGLYVVEGLWAAVCFASNINPAWIPVAVAEGVVWLVLYTYSITILAASLKNGGYDPWFRFWVLLFTGLIFCFGAFCLIFGPPILGGILAHKDVTDNLLAVLPGAWILFVFKCMACIALFAAAIATLFGA